MEKVAAYEEMIWEDILEKEAMNRFDKEMWEVAKVHAAGAPSPKFIKGRLGKYIDGYDRYGSRYRAQLQQAVASVPKSKKDKGTMYGMRDYYPPRRVMDFYPATGNTGLTIYSQKSTKGRDLSQAIERNKNRNSSASSKIPNHLKSYF